MSENLKNLQLLGLNKNQAKIYLAGLELGPATVIQLSRHTGITRTTVYDNLRVLKEHGLAIEVIDNGKHLFSAESPAKLLQLLDDKKQKIGEIIPDLITLFNTAKPKPKIQFFCGLQGIAKIMELSIAANRERKIMILGDLKTQFSWLNEDERTPFKQARLKRGIHTYIISTNSYEELSEFSHRDPQKHQRDLRHLRLAPADLKIPLLFYLFNTRVALLSSKKEGYSMIIDSPEFSTALQSLFRFLWEISKEFTMNKHADRTKQS